MATIKRLTRSFGVVSIGIFLSRVLGYVRFMVIAHVFGAGSIADCFFSAFMLPNLLRKLFGEGALSSSFVPVFTEYLTDEERQKMWHLTSTVINILLITLTTITIIVISAARPICSLVFPGFIGDRLALTTDLLRVMFPYCLFICLGALVMGILNSFRHFSTPALSPAFLNIVMIGSIFFLCPYFKEEIFGLAFGVLVGGGVQLFIMVPSLLKRGFRYSMIMDLSHPGIRKIARLFFPMALGLAVMQINVLVGFLFGSLLEEGRISALRYANIVTHLPISLFGVSIATVVFPEISISKARGQIEEFKTTLATGLRMVTFSTLPAMVGLIVLRYPIIKVLFERGAFSPESTHLTSFALLFYSLGILSFSFYTILVRAFYALHDTRTPLFVGLISALTNVLFCFLLMKPLSHGGLALAGSISATLSTAILLYLLRKRIGPLEEQDILNTFFRSSISAIIMGGVCIFFINYLNESLFIGLVLTILAGTATYLLCTRMCGMEEPRLLLQHATKTKRGREVSDEPSD